MILRRFAMLVVCTVVLCMTALTTTAQEPANPSAANAMPSVIVVPPAAQPSAHFDAQAATEAYLAEIPPAAKARSDAYFEGGYWLILWDFLYGIVVVLILLHFRWSAGMRDRAEKMTRFKPLQTIIYWLQYVIVTTILGFPIAVYEGFFRERQYGLATQTFGPWMGDQAKEFGVSAVLGAIIAVLLFGVVRKLAKSWHIWASIVTMLFLILVVMIAPVYIVPIFNNLKRLDNPKVTVPIISMARANSIPVNDVYEIDASRQ